jgi:cupin 2 domain-containing protein
MTQDSDNIFSNIPLNPEEELFEELFKGKSVRIERIISNGQSSPDGFWYDQEWDEWVILLSGSAELEFEDGNKINLTSGDYLYIPAKKRHRVNSTSKDEQSIWLAVHFTPEI